jgi:homoserine O-acetyltransferase
MITHDVAELYGGSIDQAADAVEAELLIVVAEHDQSVTPGAALQFAELIDAETLLLTSDCGHLAFSCELDTVRTEVQRFLGR